MGLQQGLFAVKLCELEQEYGRLQSRIHLFQEKDEKQTLKELEKIRDEYRERELLLKERIQSSRSLSAASLAKAQMEYGKQMEQILRDKLPNEMQGRNQTYADDQAEVMSLYAEYAIDFATQSMRHALFAALSALLLQQLADNQSKTKGDFK